MTTYAGTITAPGTGYYLQDWAVVAVEFNGTDWFINATAAVDSAGDYSLESPDLSTRQVILVPYQPMGVPWSAGLSVAEGDYVYPSTGFAGVNFRAGGSGTTGGSEPTWDNTHADTTADNGITWTCVEYLGSAANRGKSVQGPYRVAIDFVFARYIRLYCTNAQAVYYRVGDVQIRAAPEGDNLCVGGTASSDGTYSGFSAAAAFDGTHTTQWAGDAGASRTLQYDFGESVGMREFRIYVGGPSGAELNQNKFDFEFQISDNGTDWTTLFSVQRGDRTYANGDVYTVDLLSL